MFIIYLLVPIERSITKTRLTTQIEDVAYHTEEKLTSVPLSNRKQFKHYQEY